MKKLMIVLCLFLFCSTILAQSVKDITLPFREVEYVFEIKRFLESQKGVSLQNDIIYYVTNHRRGGFIGSGNILLPSSEIPKRTHVKSIKISSGKLVIKMEDGYEYKYQIIDNDFYPL